VLALGKNAKGLQVGQRVGVGWSASSCLHCREFLSGHHNLAYNISRTARVGIIGIGGLGHMGQKAISGSPAGSPTAMDRMLEFSARHSVAPVVETFPMSKVNDALEHLRAGKARYRIVLEADFR
jgi:D-arabinose 1-dehydrogenase-like Zn-dependent alcohol dehydrogenase